MDDSKAIAEKLFDCTEAVMQEWIADFFGVPVEEIFDDYTDTSSVIGLTYAGKQYNAYLVTMDKGTTSLVSADLLKNSEDVRKTCSMLFDGVYQVYSALAMTANQDYRERLRAMMPKFEEQSMSFQLIHVNARAVELQIANDQNNKLRNLMQSGEELSDEQKSSLLNSVAAIKEVMLRNTREVLDAAEVECRKLNAENQHNLSLHIVLEEAGEDNEEDRIEEGLSRMPDFGTRYHNPDESNFIEDLKKEYSVE